MFLSDSKFQSLNSYAQSTRNKPVNSNFNTIGSNSLFENSHQSNITLGLEDKDIAPPEGWKDILTNTRSHIEGRAKFMSRKVYKPIKPDVK